MSVNTKHMDQISNTRFVFAHIILRLNIWNVFKDFYSSKFHLAKSTTILPVKENYSNLI